MDIPAHIAEKLLRIVSGERIPASRLKHDIVQELYNEEVLQKQVKGRTQFSYYCTNPRYLEAYLRNNYGINDIGKYIHTKRNEGATRADSVEAASNSKLKRKRTLEGFFVASFEPIDTYLDGDSFLINPVFGTSVFINEYRNFLPASDVVIVGVENAENFKFVEKQKYLFEDLKVLFVFKHPQSNDLIKWLQSIPNKYLHFGDFDFCALTIYYSQYKVRIKKNCNLFVPDKVEDLIKSNGNSDLYDGQLQFEPKGDALMDPAIRDLITVIHRHKKGLEQELFINLGPV